MATSAQFVTTIQSATVNIATANAGRDGTGTIGTLISAAANGTRVDDIYICATGTTTTGMIRFYLHDGSTARMLFEVSVTAITPSATVQAFNSQLKDLGLIIKTGHSLRVSTEKAESFNISVTRGGDF